MALPNPPKRNAGFKLLLSMACLVIVIAGLKTAGAVLIPIVLGFFLAVLSLPITSWLEKRRVPIAIAVLATVVIDLLVFTGIIFIAASIMPDFQGAIERYVKQLHQIGLANVEKLQVWMAENEALNDFDVELKTVFEQLFNVNNLLSIVEWVNQTDVVQRITSLLTKAFFAFILMIFILAEAGKFSEKLEEIMEAKGPDFQRLRNVSRDVQRYLGIKTIVSVATGILGWSVCVLFGVEFAVLWGMVAFLFNYVPTIGSLLAAIPPVLLGLIDGFWPSFGIMLCYLGINVCIGNFIEPMLLGQRFGISTVVVILSVLFWGFIWGPVGMFLAVPLTMIIKMMLDNSDDFRWLSVAMGKTRGEELGTILGDKVKSNMPRGSEEAA